MPFPYYRRLSARERAIYRKSDAVVRLQLPGAASMAPLLEAVAAGLAKNDVRVTQRASTQLVGAVVAALAAPPVTVRVLARRPADDESELHGFYEAEEGKRALIRVWMRTAVHARPVAQRSFVRTLLHEICHHVDYTVLSLDESFHTEGFFRREAHLARQLFGEVRRTPRQLGLGL